MASVTTPSVPLENRAAISQKRILLECTYVYDHPEAHTGIQRVVRNIIRCAVKHETACCIPVIIKNQTVHEVLQFAPRRTTDCLLRIKQIFSNGSQAYWHLYRHIENVLHTRHKRFMQRMLYTLFKVGSFWYLLPNALITLVTRRPTGAGYTRPLVLTSQDTLVLLDSSWHTNFGRLVSRLKGQGVVIVAVLYDLIPLTHPQYCDRNLCKVFERWFAWVIQASDGFLTISQTVRDEIVQAVSDRLGESSARQRWYNHFYLASELDKKSLHGRVRGKIQRIFSQDSAVYLLVSTLEPRKNHAYALDAFEKLWAQDSKATLFFIGRIGWKCDRLLDRIKNHPALNQKLFFFTDVDDTELEYCYQKARATLMPSHTEGFGLPLVEALQRGIPVMASDLPVFREICGDACAYFELDKPETLAHLVTSLEIDGELPGVRPTNTWHWCDWTESSAMFLEPLINPHRRHYPITDRTPTEVLRATTNAQRQISPTEHTKRHL